MNYICFPCLALIEHETSLLYEAMIEKVENPKVKLLLLNILEETKKHREVLKAISETYGQEYPPSVSKCEDVLGKVFRGSIEFTKTLKEDVLKGYPIKAAVEKLIHYEENIGEEYLNQIQSRVTAYMMEDPAIKKILEYINADELRHVDALRQALILL